VIDAEPGSTIGIGLRQSLTSDPLPKAALDGSIVDLMEWRTVTAGDFFYVPPRTVHAIGGGISLLEFQQNSDVTYRLYDYGRPRGLRLEDAVAVAKVAEYPKQLFQHVEFAKTGFSSMGPSSFSFMHIRTRCRAEGDGSCRSTAK
jgi:mannose-6-phosphate isomerase